MKPRKPVFPPKPPSPPKRRRSFTLDRPNTIWLDIDGVLSFQCEDCTSRAPCREHEHRQALVAGATRVWVDPPTLQVIPLWDEHADIRWHTWWQEDARKEFAPAVRLPDFELSGVDKYTCESSIRRGYKLEDFVTKEVLSGKLAWIDDQIDMGFRATKQALEREMGERFLSVSTDHGFCKHMNQKDAEKVLHFITPEH